MSSDRLSRRSFLAAAGASAAVLAGRNEADVVDERLARKVTLAVKATALTDLCDHLSAETGARLVAGASVADEKVTLFCKQMPLRDVMRQLSRPFGYTWLRSGTPGAYRYELVQDLRSQLLEEELRNRDRHAALLALEKEIEPYHQYLELSPDEALARAKTASPEEQKILGKLTGSGWGGLQMYFRLTAQQQAALRSGQSLHFSQSPKPGELELPAEIARGVLQSLRDVFFSRGPDHIGVGSGITNPGPNDIRPSAFPEARADIDLSVRQTELGEIAIQYQASTYNASDRPEEISRATVWDGDGSLAVGASPAVTRPNNRAANARLAREAALQKRVAIETAGSCRPAVTNAASESPASSEPPEHPGERRATSADLLEAVHHATGFPVVGDFYARLAPPDAVSVRDQPLFDALNQVADAMRLRWMRDGDWLQFRSAGYYDDRLKEVPNRLLTRWAASRKQRGALTLDDLVEVAGLTDAQLDASGMAEGAVQCWGLKEWRLFDCNNALRRHVRFLAELTPAQRQETMSPTGLAFTKLSLPQQQQFIALALRFDSEPLQSLEELEGAAMRVDYTQPGSFEWRPPAQNWCRWVVPLVPGRDGRRQILPPSRGRTPQEARAAAGRIDPPLLEALLTQARRLHPEIQTAAMLLDAGEIASTALDLTILYIPGHSNRRNLSVVSTDSNFHTSTW